MNILFHTFSNVIADTLDPYSMDCDSAALSVGLDNFRSSTLTTLAFSQSNTTSCKLPSFSTPFLNSLSSADY